MTEFDTRIQQKGDSQANFEANNPVLLKNELVIVTMTNGNLKIKIGDGENAFNDLQYIDYPITEEIDNINNILNTKANINNPTFTGIPTAPTASSETNNTQIATTAFVRDQVDPIKEISNQNTEDINNLGTSVSELQTAISEFPDTTQLVTATDAGSIEATIPQTFDGHTIDDFILKTGGTLTGSLTAYANNNYQVAQVRNIFFSESEPDNSIGQNGDICFVYGGTI